MKTLIQKVIKCCAFFYYFEFENVYSDWKPKNLIWAGDEFMLVDIVLHKYAITAIFYYYLNDYELTQKRYSFVIYQNSSTFFNEVDGTRKTNPDPRWQIRGMHNACRALLYESTKDGYDAHTSDINIIVIYNTLQALSKFLNIPLSNVERKSQDIQKRLGVWLLSLAETMDPNPRLPITSGGNGSAAETYSTGSSAGSPPESEGRSALLRALSGLGIVVLTSFLRR